MHRHYRGIDLHTRTMYVCIIDAEGEVLFHRNLDARPGKLLEAIAPYRDDLVISTGCMRCWYWLTSAPSRGSRSSSGTLSRAPWLEGSSVCLSFSRGEKT
jgi:hypothetical protein